MLGETQARPVQMRDAQKGEFLAVRSVVVEAAVDGPLSRTTLQITFVNDLERTLEGDLVFPLPPFACLRSLEVRCGKRLIQGRVRPRARAQAEFARAVAAGQTAALGESEGEDLARLRIAPIEKGEDVELKLVLYHPLSPISDGHRMVIPLTYMPRFVEDEKALKDVERAALNRPRPLTLQARASIAVTIQHPESGTLQVRCSSHKTVSSVEGRKTVVKVEQAPLDRDMHLEILDRPSPNSKPFLWVRYDSSEGLDGLGPTTAVAVVPPAFADEGKTTPRTVTFLVDRSGSMSGGPMASAIRAVRGCLRALTPDDRFNVVAFDDRLEVLARRPLPFDDASLKAADRFISSIDARGGTEASRAMMAVLDDVQSGASSAAVEQAPSPDPHHRLRVVVFMTDGDVAGAEQVLSTAKAKLVDTRLHVIGIGESVNHAMLAVLAQLGGGTYTPVSTDEDLEDALTRLKNAINCPLWTGVRAMIDSEGDRLAPKQLEPSGPLDLFAGQPLLLAWRGALKRGDRLVLEGQDPSGEDLELVYRLPVEPEGDASPGGADAALLWALLKNRRLTYQFNPADDPTLEGLGTSFGIVNRTVALVGVHEEQRNVTVDGSVAVSLPMPRNLAASGGFPAQAPASFGAAPASFGAAPGFGAAPPAPCAPGPAAYASADEDLCCAMPCEAEADQPDYQPSRGLAPEEPEEDGSLMNRVVGKAKGLFKRGAKPAPAAPPAAKPPAVKSPAPAKPMAPLPKVAAPSPKMSAPMPAPAMMPMPAPYVPAQVAEPAPMADSAPRLSLTDNDAGLRAMLLQQGVDGLFASNVGATLAAVAVLVSRGHTSREGLFRAELRRTLTTLRSKLAALTGDSKTWAALAVAILTMPHGDAAPAELPQEIAGLLADHPITEIPALRGAIKAALGAAPSGWNSHPLAAEVQRTFGL